MQAQKIKPFSLFIIDAIGPFFHGYKTSVYNWSKIPFHHLERQGTIRQKLLNKIERDFECFIQVISDLGYNAISIDDIAHLVYFDFYPDSLIELIRTYQIFYERLFKIARSRKLKIFVTSDVMFFNHHIEKWTRGRFGRIITVFNWSLEKLFHQFKIDGIILRIGESDGVDVKGEFLSRLTLTTPKQTQQFLSRILPVCERFKKLCIFRTWTVGAYPIGDLMFNPKTFQKAFENIHSPAFVISHKYGDSDFFDTLQLTPIVRNCEFPMILELQTRREREGFGEFPFYVGWQYENYYQQLKYKKNMLGISVWCQSGGWSRHKNITYLKKSSVWNELNTEAVLDIFRGKFTADEALKIHLPDDDWAAYVKTFHETYQNILYIDGFSEKTFYFRRFRVPPLLWVFWDHIFINSLLISLFHFSGMERFRFPRQNLSALLRLGKKINLPHARYLYDTLKLLAFCRKALRKGAFNKKLMKKIEAYESQYPNALQFSVRYQNHSDSLTRWLLEVLLRQRPEYRFLDQILINPIISFLLRFLVRLAKQFMPGFVNKQAMKTDVLFK